MWACNLGLVGLGIRLGLVLRIWLVLGLEHIYFVTLADSHFTHNESSGVTEALLLLP